MVINFLKQVMFAITETGSTELFVIKVGHSPVLEKQKFSHKSHLYLLIRWFLSLR